MDTPSVALLIFFFGLGYSLLAATSTTALIYLAPTELIGIAQSMPQLGTGLITGTFIPLLGYVHDVTIDEKEGYYWPWVLSLGICVISVILSVLLTLDDIYYNG